MMKRFGVQIAGSGIVILLGALGVAQAQRDSQTSDSAQWETPASPALTPPPAPIAAVAEKDDAGPSMMGLGAFDFPTSPADVASPTTANPGVRTVAHEEPLYQPGDGPNTDLAGNPPTAKLGLPGWSMQDNAAPADNALPASGPAMMMPTDDPYEPAAHDSSLNAQTMAAPPAHGSEPPSMQFDGAPPAVADDAPDPAAAYDAMPTLQFDDAPSNGLRDAGIPAEQPRSIAPMPTPIPTDYPVADLRPLNQPPAPVAAIPPQAQPEMRIAALPSASLTGMGSALQPMADDIVLAEPGDRRLDGVQSPSIVIQKRAPEEVKVGKPATFTITVQNVGAVEALDVRVHDRIPAGMRLVDAAPAPIVQGDLLLWQLGAVEPSGQRTITMQLIPEQEGELGSVARVTFEAAASVRTISTRPELKITQRSVEKVLIGQQLEIELEISNPGTGAATGVILQEDVPEGLEHPKGRQLDNVIGVLAPGEVRRQVLRLRAASPGMIENRIRLIGDDGLLAENAIELEVIAPKLAIELDGPSRRFLERQATFNINLANIGSADATNVEVVAYLDRGFSFVGTEYQGQYDPNRHAVYWSLAELPADGRGSVPLRLLPIEQGERAIRLEAKGDLNLIAQHEKIVTVDTLAELTFSITDDADPIEVGSDATYEIRINNRGSRDDSDVKMQMQLPAGLELVSSEAEASTDGRGLIAFAPTASLRAGGEIVHRVRVRGTAPGTHIVKAIVTSAQANVPVTKEESTMVYADQ